ncbi:ATP-binding protein [Dactylosporangium sp. NPDC050688]|uniref:ATP-binding protein n=1 Tax=Dactylosporangium sp. NPDC050688 TaxID=3157217 RepID=UPI00340BBE2E
MGRLESVSTTVAERAWCVVVPHHARGAHLARHRLAHELDALLTEDRLDDAVAIAAELVGNAVRHAAPLPGDVIRVAWRLLDDDTLEIRVTDGGSPAGPELRVAAPDAIDGRGLTIVAALATGWGVERDGLGQCVWATL